jgi:hypothetical protein
MVEGRVAVEGNHGEEEGDQMEVVEEEEKQKEVEADY